MDEVITDRTTGAKFREKLAGIFIIEPVSFSTKKRINIKGIAWLGCSFLGIFCVAVFFIPSPQKQTATYSEQMSQASAVAQNPTGTNQPQFVSPQASDQTSDLSSSVSYVPRDTPGATEENGNASMIIRRDNDMSTTLPPGTRFWVRLAEKATVTNQTMPIIGVVSSPVESASDVAIPEDSKIFGEAVVDSDSERANVTWKSVLFADGRSKNLSAIALGSDDQPGIDGDYHSDALKNTAGEVISDFAAGFAQGAMTTTPFGMNAGGVQNGVFQGLANTAQNRADSWGENLKKPRGWVVLNAGAKFQVVLSQPFIFRDPGGVN